jgi:hypothetical protein
VSRPAASICDNRTIEGLDLLLLELAGLEQRLLQLVDSLSLLLEFRTSQLYLLLHGLLVLNRLLVVLLLILGLRNRVHISLLLLTILLVADVEHVLVLLNGH